MTNEEIKQRLKRLSQSLHDGHISATEVFDTSYDAARFLDEVSEAIKLPPDESRYKKALDNYAEELEAAHRMSQDTFKPPEMQVMEAKRLLSAIWELQVEYAAMMQKHEGEQ